MEEIKNRITQSGLITLDIADLIDKKTERVVYDVKENLYKGLVLKEKDFREFIRLHDWTRYQGKFVIIMCSADAIVPTWAYMLLTSKITPFAKKVIFGSSSDLDKILLLESLKKLDLSQLKDAKVVVKGCSDLTNISEYVMVALTSLLQPLVSSIMYGEPCSTVPIYKKKKILK